MVPKFTYFAYCYPYKFFYVGWIMRKAESGVPYYCDPSLEEIRVCESQIVYMCTGLTQDSVMDKLKKYVSDHRSEQYD